MDIEVKDTCNNNSQINDVRQPNSFKLTSFSNFKRTDVKKKLIENIHKNKLEPACYWCAELVCSGHYMDIWEIILHYTGKHIHLGNPKIVIYLEMRYQLFKDIMSQGHYVSEIDLRNNTKIRQLFAEIIVTLSLSNKKHSFESIKINRVEEFDMTQMTERFKASSMDYGQPIMKPEDPKELFIAINEFSYTISTDAPNTINACYWIEWIIDFDTICKNRKLPCLCQRRSTIPVENKFQRDIIWIMWDALIYYCEKVGNQFIIKIMKSLLQIFCIKYTTACCKKRRFLLYFAVSLLTEHVPTNTELMPNKPLIQKVLMKIDEIYKQIKKNEESPNTDYLFSNLDKNASFERSLKKMELMNSITGSMGLPSLLSNTYDKDDPI